MPRNLFRDILRLIDGHLEPARGARHGASLLSPSREGKLLRFGNQRAQCRCPFMATSRHSMGYAKESALPPKADIASWYSTCLAIRPPHDKRNPASVLNICINLFGQQTRNNPPESRTGLA